MNFVSVTLFSFKSATLLSKTSFYFRTQRSRYFHNNKITKKAMEGEDQSQIERNPTTSGEFTVVTEGKASILFKGSSLVSYN